MLDSSPAVSTPCSAVVDLSKLQLCRASFARSGRAQFRGDHPHRAFLHPEPIKSVFIRLAQLPQLVFELGVPAGCGCQSFSTGARLIPRPASPLQAAANGQPPFDCSDGVAANT